MAFSIHAPRPEGKDYTVQRMLIGTHTSDNDQNYLQIAQVQLPSDSTPIDTRKFDDERGGKETILVDDATAQEVRDLLISRKP